MRVHHASQSDFVTINTYFTMAKLPNRLRPYMQTYLTAFFSLPLVRSNGEKLSHEEVVNRLDNDTVSYEAAYGISGAFSENVRLSIRVEAGMYEAAIAWLKDLIYGSVFNKERSVYSIPSHVPQLLMLGFAGCRLVSPRFSKACPSRSATVTLYWAL